MTYYTCNNIGTVKGQSPGAGSQVAAGTAREYHDRPHAAATLPMPLTPQNRGGDGDEDPPAAAAVAFPKEYTHNA